MAAAGGAVLRLSAVAQAGGRGIAQAPADLGNHVYLPAVHSNKRQDLMTTYYVKTDGNDGLDGLSWANAWLTVNKAATTATASDTVIYADGTYDLGTGQATWNSGSAGNVITHQAFNRRLAAWEQSAIGTCVTLDAESYIAFQDLVIQGDNVHEQTALVRIRDGSHHIALDDCELGESSEADYGLFIRTCDDITIDNCEIHPNNGANGKLDGIHVRLTCNDIIIRDTEVYHCDHEAISVTGCDGLLIDNCHLHHTGSHGIGIGDGPDLGHALDDILIRDCSIHDNDTSYDHTGGWHSNVRIHRHVSNLTLLRCELYNAATYGLMMTSEVTGPIYIYNNVIYNQGLDRQTEGAVVFSDFDVDDNIADNIYYKNNIVFVTQVGPKAFKADAAFTGWVEADNNLYYSSSATKEIRRGGTTYTAFQDYLDAGYEANAVIDDDPDFKDAGSADFVLRRWSPAINEGVDIGQPYRGPAPDIGAHEHRGFAIVGIW